MLLADHETLRHPTLRDLGAATLESLVRQGTRLLQAEAHSLGVDVWLAVPRGPAGHELSQATLDTLWMVLPSAIVAQLLGIVLGAFLTLTRPGGLRPHAGVFRVLDAAVNVGRR